MRLERTPTVTLPVVFTERVIARLAVLATWFAAAASMAVLVTLAFKSQPLGDDFCTMAMSASDAWTDIVRGYFSGGGRWLARALRILTMGGMDFAWNYGAYLCAVMALRLFATYRLARTVLVPELPRLRIAFFAGGFCLLYWCCLASAGDSLFWLTGAIEYEVTTSGILLFLSFLWSGKWTPLKSGLLAAGAFVLTGGHEVEAIALVAILAAGCWLAWMVRSPDRGRWLIVLLASLAGALIVVLAPGNFVRARTDQLMAVRDIPRTMASTLVHLGAWVPRWLLDAPVLLGASILVLDPAWRLRREWVENTFVRKLVAGVGCFVIVTAFFLAGWTPGRLVPGRLLNWIQLVFLLTLSAMILFWKGQRLPSNARLMPLLVAATFVSMFVAGNPWLGLADLVVRVPAWSQSRTEALAILRSVAGRQRQATFPQLPPVPHMYFPYDASRNTTDHPNECLARYYGFESVMGSETSSSPRGAALSGRHWGVDWYPVSSQQ